MQQTAKGNNNPMKHTSTHVLNIFLLDSIYSASAMNVTHFIRPAQWKVIVLLNSLKAPRED